MQGQSEVMTFKTKQIVACISGVNVGGQPGEHPTCILPSIFYDTDKIVSDPKKGEFNKPQAETLLNHAEELSEKTGNPFFVDIMGTTAEAMIRYVDFVSEAVAVPFLVDSVSREAKLAAVRHVHEIGLTEKVIYNSVNFWSTAQELNVLQNLGVKSAVLLAYDPKAPDGGRETALAGNNTQPGLLEAAKRAGIKNILVDTAVLDVPSIGAAGNAIHVVKEKYGLPAGCAPNNAISIWKRLKAGEFGVDARRVCLGASTLFTQVMGADFVVAGPIDYADIVFPVVAMADAIVAAEAEKRGVKMPATSAKKIF
jgi:tetrahydromethanopterin S-methyltransferase subunit H